MTTTTPASRAISSSRTRARSSCPGVARTFEALARQARDAHWPHEDYLHEVLSAEHDVAPRVGDPAAAARGALSRGQDARHL